MPTESYTSLYISFLEKHQLPNKALDHLNYKEVLGKLIELLSKMRNFQEMRGFLADFSELSLNEMQTIVMPDDPTSFSILLSFVEFLKEDRKRLQVENLELKQQLAATYSEAHEPVEMHSMRMFK